MSSEVLWISLAKISGFLKSGIILILLYCYLLSWRFALTLHFKYLWIKKKKKNCLKSCVKFQFKALTRGQFNDILHLLLLLWNFLGCFVVLFCLLVFLKSTGTFHGIRWGCHTYNFTVCLKIYKNYKDGWGWMLRMLRKKVLNCSSSFWVMLKHFYAFSQKKFFALWRSS